MSYFPGVTSAVVGQPFDCIKTKMQAQAQFSQHGVWGTAREIVHSTGVKGVVN